MDRKMLFSESPYVLTDICLGEGSFGHVWLAERRDGSETRQFAVKVVRRKRRTGFEAARSFGGGGDPVDCEISALERVQKMSACSEHQGPRVDSATILNAGATSTAAAASSSSRNLVLLRDLYVDDSSSSREQRSYLVLDFCRFGAAMEHYDSGLEIDLENVLGIPALVRRQEEDGGPVPVLQKICSAAVSTASQQEIVEGVHDLAGGSGVSSSSTGATRMLNTRTVVGSTSDDTHTTRGDAVVVHYAHHYYSEGAARKLVRDLVKGVQFLHETCGIAHRDVKPMNLLIDGAGVGKLTDFGRAVIFGGTTTTSASAGGEAASDLTRESEGTYAFFPPEAADADYRGSWSLRQQDIWAVGVTAYCLLFGKCPFYHPGPVRLFDQIKALEYEIPLPGEVGRAQRVTRYETSPPRYDEDGDRIRDVEDRVRRFPAVSESARAFLEKCLQKEAGRWRSCAEMLAPGGTGTRTASSLLEDDEEVLGMKSASWLASEDVEPAVVLQFLRQGYRGVVEKQGSVGNRMERKSAGTPPGRAQKPEKYEFRSCCFSSSAHAVN